jgi:hypothetical protein
MCSVIQLASKKAPGWDKAQSFAALKRLRKILPDYLWAECSSCGTWVLHPKGDLPIHPLCADLPVKRQAKLPDPNQGTMGI